MEGLKTSGSVYFDQSLPPSLLLPATPASPRALLTPAASGRPYTCSGLTQWGHHPGTGRMVGVMHSLWLAGADCTWVSAAAWSPSPGTFMHHLISAWAQAEPVCGCKSIMGKAPFAAACTDLKGVMLSEINRTEKDKYCITSLIVESKYNKSVNITKKK